MLSTELEYCLNDAFQRAREERHEFITVEHLLMALLDNPSAAEVLRACAANIDDLRKSLSAFIKENTPTVGGTDEVDTQPTLGFQRVIQRAILHVQSKGKKEVTGANVLVAIFGEKDSHAEHFLGRQRIGRVDVLNYVSHGVTKAPGSDSAEAINVGDVQVVIRDDHLTPMDFLARVLQKFFEMNREDAAETMLEIYRDGSAVCGLYSRKDGEALVDQVLAHARESGYPLNCSVVGAK
jgi:ATP-dependent Clp protease ATP-binding subunit ClpA